MRVIKNMDRILVTLTLSNNNPSAENVLFLTMHTGYILTLYFIASRTAR